MANSVTSEITDCDRTRYFVQELVSRKEYLLKKARDAKKQVYREPSLSNRSVATTGVRQELSVYSSMYSSSTIATQSHVLTAERSIGYFSTASNSLFARRKRPPQIFLEPMRKNVPVMFPHYDPPVKLKPVQKMVKDKYAEVLQTNKVYDNIEKPYLLSIVQQAGGIEEVSLHRGNISSSSVTAGVATQLNEDSDGEQGELELLLQEAIDQVVPVEVLRPDPVTVNSSNKNNSSGNNKNNNSGSSSGNNIVDRDIRREIPKLELLPNEVMEEKLGEVDAEYVRRNVLPLYGSKSSSKYIARNDLKGSHSTRL